MASFTDILTYLEENFENDWLDQYLNVRGKITTNNKRLISSKIQELLKETIDVFFTSLISGEYSLDTSLVIQQVESLKTNINLLLNPVAIDDFNTQEFLWDALKVEYIDILKVFSNLYLNFIKLVQSQNENPNIDIVYEASFDTIKFFNQISDKDVKSKVQFYDLIISIYRIDHFFNDDVSTYKMINQLENSIKKHQAEKYFISIKEKLNFLKFKWEIRQKSYKRNNFKISKAYIIDDELFLSTDNVLYNPSLEKLQIWKEYIEVYYELGDWKSKLSTITNNFKHQNYAELPILKLILLLKYYKDVNKEYGNLKDVVKEFKSRYIENNSLPKRFSYNKTYLYALNNKFSSLIEQKNIIEQDIQNLKNEIERTQNKSNIDNFFIESKHIAYRINLLDSKFKNREELEDLSKDKDELDILTTDVCLYKEKLKWSKNNHNLLFQLPYEECLIDSNLEELNIFYASSIALPLPHEESENNYEKINDNLKELKQLVLSVVSLNKEFSTIKRLKQEIESNQIKTFETIGLFTAITAFILASIPSFTFVKEFYQALLFTGIIGSCLIIMISTIFLFTRGFKKIKSWTLIIIAIFIFLFALISLSNAIDKVEIDIKKNFIKRLDSIKIEKNNIILKSKFYNPKEYPISKK